MKLLLIGALLFCCVIKSVLSVECYSCFPPMPEEECKRSGQRMDCRHLENIGYNSCIEVQYHGNDSLARSCYPSYKCDGAREWCRRYGPCTVKCCGTNLCNGGSNLSAFQVFSVLLPVLASLFAL